MSVHGTAEGQAQKVLQEAAREHRENSSASGAGERRVPQNSETGHATGVPKSTEAPAPPQQLTAAGIAAAAPTNSIHGEAGKRGEEAWLTAQKNELRACELRSH